MKVSWKKHRLKLKEVFAISYGSYTYRNALLVTLSCNEFSGYGECVEIDYYHIHLSDFILKLEEIQRKIERQPLLKPEEFYLFLEKMELHPFLRSALDCAYWDLYGKLEGKSFAELNNLATKILPESSLTISIAKWEEQAEKILQSEWNLFKVKTKGLDKEHIFKIFETGKKIALDANASFTYEDCYFLQNSPLSKGFLYAEQPKPVGLYGNLERNLSINWMADEDCQNISFLKKLQPHYSSVNVKLMKCGGITPALQLIAEAKIQGFKVMIGCMTESSVGISAGIAVAGLCDFADLDGAHLISNDFAKGSYVEKGKLLLSETSGLGISLI